MRFVYNIEIKSEPTHNGPKKRLVTMNLLSGGYCILYFFSMFAIFNWLLLHCVILLHYFIF